jgi:hypothetical protein
MFTQNRFKVRRCCHSLQLSVCWFCSSRLHMYVGSYVCA